MNFAPAALLLCLTLLPLRAAGESPAPTLQVTAGERGFFQLGDRMGRAAFAYADLARQAAQVAHTRGRLTQVQRLAALAPVADRSRADARAGFAEVLLLMRSLQAPPSALVPVQNAAVRLDRPVSLRGDARTVSLFSGAAARTLGALDEFGTLSSLPGDPAVQTWVTSPAAGASGRVWYAEGLIAALTEIAAAQQMPELLPPVGEISTDLRGLRDWLSLRLPDTPSPDQAALVAAINAFLDQTSRTGDPSPVALTVAQLQGLGDISRRLQALVIAPAPGGPT